MLQIKDTHKFVGLVAKAKSNHKYGVQERILKYHLGFSNIDKIFYESVMRENVEDRQGLRMAAEYARDNNKILAIPKVDMLGNTDVLRYLITQTYGKLYICGSGQDPDKELTIEKALELYDVMKAMNMLDWEVKFSHRIRGSVDEETYIKRMHQGKKVYKPAYKKSNVNTFVEEEFEIVKHILKTYVFEANTKKYADRKKVNYKNFLNFGEIADDLNSKGWRTVKGGKFMPRTARYYTELISKYYDIIDKASNDYKQKLFNVEEKLYTVKDCNKYDGVYDQNQIE